MNLFHQLLELIPVSLLFLAMNVAVPVSIIAAVALVATRLRNISLPVRHAICVCAAAGVLATPLLVVTVARWAPGITEIALHERQFVRHSGSKRHVVPEPAAHHATSTNAPLNDHLTAEMPPIDVTSQGSEDEDSIVIKSTRLSTQASLATAEPTVNIGDGGTSYGLMFGKFVVVAWFIGSVVFLIRRVHAEIRLRRWLETCDPIADVETLQAAQSAAMIVGLNDHYPLRRLAVQFRLRRWSSRRGRIEEAETLEAVQSAATAVGVDQRPLLLRSKTLPTPVVCGVLHPKLILPEAMANGAENLSHDQLSAVLAHEMAHLARRDLVTGLCLTIARIAYWWNPLVHWLCRHTEDLGEQICDDIATASLQQPREYVTALLHFAERSTNSTPQSASLGLSLSTVSQLEIRIRRILHSARSKTLRVSATACVVVVLMATVLTAAASMMQIREAVDEQPATENSVARSTEARPSHDREQVNDDISTSAVILAAQDVSPKTQAVLDDRELLIKVVDAKNNPIVGATVRTSTEEQELEILITNDSGQVASKKRGTENTSIQTEAPGYRRTTTQVVGSPTTLKIMMLPMTQLTVVDEDGKPQSSVFVGRERLASMNLDFDRNSFPVGPNLDFGRSPKEERTDNDGRFQLVNDITLRTLENQVPLWAIDDNGDRFGWTWVPPAELDQPQTLVLKKTAFVEAAFLIKQQTGENVYSWSLLDSGGFRIAGVAPNVSSLGTNACCNLRFRLPPGDYFLRREIPNGKSATSVFGFEVVPDQAHVDLGLVEELSDAIDTDSEWGSLYGRVQVTNPDRIDLRPKLVMRGGANRVFPVDVFSDDLLIDPQSGGLEGVFVYLAKAPSVVHPDAARIPITPLIFDQAAGRFAPHLMIVRIGQSVECVNTSTIATSVHNFPFKNQAVNLLLRPLTNPGAGHIWTPKIGESMPFKVASDFHPWMQAYWLVLDHPYAAITDQQGRFVIENLPPGKHIFKVWHERVGYIERKLEVTIEPGQITAQPTITVEAAKLATP